MIKVTLPFDSYYSSVVINIISLGELNQSALDLLNDQHATLLDYNIQLDYSHFNADQILKSVLPHDLIKDGTPTSFAQTGHLAHFNLRPEYLPYKNLIGQVILDVSDTYLYIHEH